MTIVQGTIVGRSALARKLNFNNNVLDKPNHMLKSACLQLLRVLRKRDHNIYTEKYTFRLVVDYRKLNAVFFGKFEIAITPPF